jgi:hypothetical protein
MFELEVFHLCITFQMISVVPLINPSVAPHCQSVEILHVLVPGSLIERVFGNASLGLIADHAKESR